MANVIERADVIEAAKAANAAYTAKDWDKLKELFAENGVYDEKATGRRLQGIGHVLEAWQGWTSRGCSNSADRFSLFFLSLIFFFDF